MDLNCADIEIRAWRGLDGREYKNTHAIRLCYLGTHESSMMNIPLLRGVGPRPAIGQPAANVSLWQPFNFIAEKTSADHM